MKRGDIHLVDFEPAKGSEVDKLRPAVVVSTDDSNEAVGLFGKGMVTFVPFTTNVSRVYPFQVFIPAAESGLDHDSKAQVEQVRAVDASRVHRLIGMLPTIWMTAVDDALRVHLDL